MKKLNLNAAIALLGAVTIILSSCSTDKGLSVTKRKHRGGYHVEWHGNKKVKKVKEESVASAQTREDMQLMDLRPTDSPEASLNTTPADFSSTSINNDYTQNTELESTGNVETVSSANAMSRAEYRKYKKEFRKNLKQQLKQSSKEGSEGTPQWLIIVLCIILPPLGVALALGVHLEFWLSLILTLLGWLPGVIYSLIVVL